MGCGPFSWSSGLLAVACLSFPTGCSGDGGGDGTSGASGITTTQGTNGTDSAGTTTDSGPEKFDIGETTMATTGDNQGGDGCEKVDFVFVIDSSPSMADEQVALLASFPGFIDAIEQTLDLNDFHVMVLDAGAVSGVGCDGMLGAGRTSNGMGADCGLVGGQRYATQAQPNLAAAFSCMAARGQAGPSNEQTMESLVNGIGALDAPGQCNEGFVRDDAVLVVTLITDEEDNAADINPAPLWDGTCEPADDDTNSVGNPQTWYDAVVAEKNGDPSAVVVLSLIGDCDVGGTCAGIVFDPLNPTASTGAEPSPQLRAFTSMFGYGTTGPVCAPDYAPFFADAVSVISSACDDFLPPG